MLGLLLTLYVVVALVNYSVVQSYAGAWVGNYFSKEWGCQVSIGSLHAMPWDHVILDRVLWIDPQGDTLFRCQQLRVTFDRFPFHDNGLDFRRVTLKNTYYHLAINNNGINLKFVIDYFKPKHPSPSKPHPPFTVKVGTLELDNVHYRMDLPDHRETVYAYGVQIPHMDFHEIRAKMKDVLVVNEDITCRIVRFSTREQSGFELRELSGQVHVCPQEIRADGMKIRTGASYIETDALLSYNGWMKEYLSMVNHTVELKEGTHVSMSDVAYWAPVLWGVDADIKVAGTAFGTIDSLTTDMALRWGDSSRARVTGAVIGLPDVKSTTFNIDITRMRTNQRDMATLLNRIGLSDEMKVLIGEADYVNLGATVRGGWHDQATADVAMGSGLGSLMAAATLTRYERGHRFKLKMESDKWEAARGKTSVGGWLEAEGLLHDNAESWIDLLDGKTNGELRIKTEKLRKPLDVALEATLVDGRLKGGVASTDSVADFTVVADVLLAGEKSTYNAELSVGLLDIGLLPYPFATTMKVAARGNSLETLSGTVHAQNTRYGNLKAKQIDLDVHSENGDKELELQSDIADLTMSGHFLYDELPIMLKEFGERYLPEIINPHHTPDDSLRASALADNTLLYHLHWKDGGAVIAELVPWLSVAPGTRVDGTYSFGEDLKLVVRSDSLRLGSVVLDGVGTLGYREGEQYIMDIEAQEVHIGQVDLMERVRILLGSRREKATLDLAWGTEDAHNRGDLELVLKGGSVTAEKSLFYVGDTPWRLNIDDLQITANERMRVEGRRLSIESDKQKIGARLSLCGLPTDCVEMDFNQFNLSLLSDIFLQESPLSVNGDINGRFSLYGLNETPYFNADLLIDSCVVNNQPLDTVRLTSHWNAELDLLNLNLNSRQVTADGYMELGKKAQELHFNVDFSGFELALAAPFMASFSSLFEGQLHGNFDISGTLSHPLILGEAYVDNGALKVDITNVTYRFSDSIQFDNNEVRLRDFDIVDPLGNKATLGGTLALTNDKQVEIDINLNTPNIMLLDKRGGDDFYGKILASANGRVYGTTDYLNIDVRARTNTGCELTVPITQQQRVKSQNYITFVNDFEPMNIAEVSVKDSNFNYTLNLDLNITPDMKLNLPMDFDEVGADASVSGVGDLHFSLANSTPAQLMGNYEITSGTMKVALFSLYEKRFSIKNGSNLNFPGVIPEARFDIQAVYSQRVNLSTLTGSLSNIDNTQKYIQVENVIAIAGTLNDPRINFDLNLPNADQSVEEEVFAYIDRNSERDMLTQTVSLLINGKFSNVNNNSQTEGNALDFVTSFVGNSLSDMVQFVDVNIDYKAATESTNQHLDVNISKDWGRWYLESTLGYGGESRAMEQNTVSGAMIDALIGYRVSPVFHLYAYNRTNTNDYTRIDLPYKQGAGMKLTKDFDHWGDLFKKKKSKKEK